MVQPILVLRYAVIRNPDYGRNVCEIEYLDRTFDEMRETTILPHPFPAGEIGIYSAIRDGQVCVVGKTYMGKPIIVSLVNNPIFTGGYSIGVLDSSYVSPPTLAEGELVLKGAKSASTLFSQDGNISTSFGISKQVLDSFNRVSLRTDQEYLSTSAGYTVSGQIYREAVGGERKATLALDRIADADYDNNLAKIGRNSLLTATAISGEIASANVLRNPPLVENRHVVFEFSRDAEVLSVAAENQLYKNRTVSQVDKFADTRQATRTNAFDIGPATYNTLVEKLEGTGVDFSGNILDLNRKAISFEGMKDSLDDQLQVLRRSIKVHYEINSRKANAEVQPDDTAGTYGDDAPKISANHSRWSLDVDAEGQTKLNIPASSPIGNIPVHVRYLPGSSVSPKYEGKTEANDIRHLPYVNLSEGIPLTEAYAPAVSVGTKTEQMKWAMPYHDLRFKDILDAEVFATSNATLSDSMTTIPPPPYSQKFSDLIGTDRFLSADKLENSGSGANAGGRSLWMNMDGSLEMSVGKDQADNKSITLDTAGSILARAGKDRLGNSVVAAADGKITLFSGSSEGSDKQGGFKLFVQTGNDVASIEIDDGNIYIRSAKGKNIVLESGNNLILDAKSKVIINGESIGTYGKHSKTGSKTASFNNIPKTGNGGN